MLRKQLLDSDSIPSSTSRVELAKGTSEQKIEMPVDVEKYIACIDQYDRKADEKAERDIKLQLTEIKCNSTATPSLLQQKALALFDSEKKNIDKADFESIAKSFLSLAKQKENIEKLSEAERNALFNNETDLLVTNTVILAIKKGYIKTLIFLLDNTYVEANKPLNISLIEDCYSAATTLLMLAAKYSYGISLLLLERYNARTQINFITGYHYIGSRITSVEYPLSCAIAGNNAKTVELLLSYGAKTHGYWMEGIRSRTPSPLQFIDSLRSSGKTTDETCKAMIQHIIHTNPHIVQDSAYFDFGEIWYDLCLLPPREQRRHDNWSVDNERKTEQSLIHKLYLTTSDSCIAYIVSDKPNQIHWTTLPAPVPFNLETLNALKPQIMEFAAKAKAISGIIDLCPLEYQRQIRAKIQAAETIRQQQRAIANANDAHAGNRNGIFNRHEGDRENTGCLDRCISRVRTTLGI